jgi:acetyl-CoA carboxylase biotin carboxyl carrier protein
VSVSNESVSPESGTSVDASDPLLASSGLSAEQLSDLLALVNGTEVTELDVTIGATRLSLRRAATPGVAEAAPAERQRLTPAETRSLAIASPLVGIFRPSVSKGETVSPGQSIGAIEALGLPTSVEAPQSGTVEDLLVKEGAAVEYGQPLLILRRLANAP